MIDTVLLQVTWLASATAPSFADPQNTVHNPKGKQRLEVAKAWEQGSSCGLKCSCSVSEREGIISIGMCQLPFPYLVCLNESSFSNLSLSSSSTSSSRSLLSSSKTSVLLLISCFFSLSLRCTMYTRLRACSDGRTHKQSDNRQSLCPL